MPAPRRRIRQPQLRIESDEEYAERHAAELAEDHAEREQQRQEDAKWEKEWQDCRPPASERLKPLLAKRHYHAYPPITPGQQFSRPADPADPLSVASQPVTVLRRVSHASSLRTVVIYHGKKRHRSPEDIEPAAERQYSYSNGLWRIECFCGAEYQAKGTDLNRLVPWALHCPACQLPRKRRTLGFRTRPGAARYIGTRHGRLTVLEWVERAGWRCECDCGTDDLVPRSRDLFRRGSEPCPHV